MMSLRIKDAMREQQSFKPLPLTDDDSDSKDSHSKHPRPSNKTIWIVNLVMLVGLIAAIASHCYDGKCKPANTDFVAGLDPSEAYMVEDNGGVFRRLDSSPVNSLLVAKENGYKWIRLRVMVEPTGAYGLAQDLDYVLRMAHDVKKHKMKFLLDFHYSHWWADGDNQWTPDHWRTENNNTDVSMEELSQHVFDHTHRVMQVLKDENVMPDAVQVGNEISAGMLWGHGKLPKHWDNDLKNLSQSWYNLAALVQSGIDAIDAVVTKKSERPEIVIHLDTGGETEFTEHWMSTYFKLGGSCDIIGLSWYPMWHGTFDDLKRNINNLSDKFPDQDVWVVETAYYYEGYCAEDDVGCNEKLPFPQTEQGQYDFLVALRQTLLQTKCKAVFYWGSHWSQPKLWFRASEDWADAERRALFDRKGKATLGIRALPGH
jgi:arabinogalactan endo-1,4-beta-galactosidase